MLGESRLPLTPGWSGRRLSTDPPPLAEVWISVLVTASATLALSLIHTKKLNIAARVTYANDEFPIVSLSKG